MIDFIVNGLAEIADFFFTFWVDNVIDKFAKRNNKFKFVKRRTKGVKSEFWRKL